MRAILRPKSDNSCSTLVSPSSFSFFLFLSSKTFFPTWIDGNAYGNVETNGEIIGGETIAGTKRKRERETHSKRERRDFRDVRIRRGKGTLEGGRREEVSEWIRFDVTRPPVNVVTVVV